MVRFSARIRKLDKGFLVIPDGCLEELDSISQRRQKVIFSLDLAECPSCDVDKADSMSAYLRKVIFYRWTSSPQDQSFDEFYLNEMQLIIDDQISYDTE